MVDLHIQQQFGRIGLKITPFQFDLHIQPPDLQVEQRPADISLVQPAAILEIDYTPARESLGYCGIEAQQRFFNQDALATSYAGIERRTKEGNELGWIEKEISIGQVAAEASKTMERDLEIESIDPIKITIKPQPIDWKVRQGGVSVDLMPGTVKGDFQPGIVTTYLEQKPSLTFKAVGSVVDVKR